MVSPSNHDKLTLRQAQGEALFFLILSLSKDEGHPT
jgi:hypothetical protein